MSSHRRFEHALYGWLAALEEHLHQVAICPVVSWRCDESIEDSEEEFVEDLDALVVVVASLKRVQELANGLIDIRLLTVELAWQYWLQT